MAERPSSPGRERSIYLDRFWNEFAADRSKIDEGHNVFHYAKLYAQPGAMPLCFLPSFSPSPKMRG